MRRGLVLGNSQRFGEGRLLGLCGCSTFVNSSDDLLVYFRLRWGSLRCDQGVTCGECPPDPIGAECATEGAMEGFCVDVFEDL